MRIRTLQPNGHSREGGNPAPLPGFGMMIRTSLAFALTLTLLATLACSADELVSRQEVLVSLTDDVIVPRYRVLAEETEALRSSLRSPV